MSGVFSPEVFSPEVFYTGEGAGAPVFYGGVFLDSVFYASPSDVPDIPGVDVSLVASFPVPELHAGVRYISGAARPLVGEVRAAYQQALKTEFGSSAAWRDSIPLPHGAASRYQDGQPLRASTESAYSDAQALRAQSEIRFQQAVRLATQGVTLRWQDALRIRSARALRFQDGLGLDVPRISARFQDARRLRRSAGDVFQDGLPLRTLLRDGFAVARPADASRRVRYQDAMQLPIGMWVDGGSSGGGGGPDPVETVIVPIRRIYTVINTATLRRVDGDVLIPTYGMQLSIDVESWTWSFSARTPGSALPDLEPVGGQPVEVEARINGVAYRAIIESISRERIFGRSDLSVSGRGKAAILDAPYSPGMTFRNTADRTVQQLANDVLTINGSSIGWDVDAGWQPEDWLVPAGVFSHQGTYISALNAIASAAGAYVQPHRTLQALSVLKRYPVAPWDWGDLDPDFELPSAVVQREAIAWVDKPVYNRVFLRGTTVGNFQGTREGTAGDLDAPQITDALLTDVIGARQRALPVFADTGRQAAVTLRLPVLAETGIIPPGKFVRYVDNGVTRIGLVRSTSAEVERTQDNGLTVWQSIGVETHV